MKASTLSCRALIRRAFIEHRAGTHDRGVHRPPGASAEMHQARTLGSLVVTSHAEPSSDAKRAALLGVELAREIDFPSQIGAGGIQVALVTPKGMENEIDAVGIGRLIR